MKNARAIGRAQRRARWLAGVALCTVVALAPSLVWSQDLGRCARVEVPWPIVLPDGSAHEAGSLKLCLQQMWTPVAGLHEIRVNGTAIGLFMSRVGRSEGPAAARAPIVVFRRNGTDEHYLAGYAWPDGEVMRTYALHKFGKVTTATARRLSLPLLDPANAEVLLVALAQ